MRKAILLLCVIALHLSCMAKDASFLVSTVKEFSAQEHISVIDQLLKDSYVFREGFDAELRPLFVSIQANFERAIVQGLRSKEIEKALCIIHTPSPATPLCTAGENVEGLVDPALLADPMRLLTVKKRPDIVRDYLAEGGLLYTVYGKGGRSTRTVQQLAILDALLQRYPNQLYAVELGDPIPEDMIGATYYIAFATGQTYFFSVRSYQANAPTDGVWAMWFGTLAHPRIVERVEAVEALLLRRSDLTKCAFETTR